MEQSDIISVVIITKVDNSILGILQDPMKAGSPTGHSTWIVAQLRLLVHVWLWTDKMGVGDVESLEDGANQRRARRRVLCQDPVNIAGQGEALTESGQLGHLLSPGIGGSDEVNGGADGATDVVDGAHL